MFFYYASIVHRNESITHLTEQIKFLHEYFKDMKIDVNYSTLCLIANILLSSSFVLKACIHKRIHS